MSRLEKAAAKFPKKDLAAVKKRFAILEVLEPAGHLHLHFDDAHFGQHYSRVPLTDTKCAVSCSMRIESN